MDVLSIHRTSDIVLKKQKHIDYITYDEFKTLKNAVHIQYERSFQETNWSK